MKGTSEPRRDGRKQLGSGCRRALRRHRHGKAGVGWSGVTPISPRADTRWSEGWVKVASKALGGKGGAAGRPRQGARPRAAHDGAKGRLPAAGFRDREGHGEREVEVGAFAEAGGPRSHSPACGERSKFAERRIRVRGTPLFRYSCFRNL